MLPAAFWYQSTLQNAQGVFLKTVQGLMSEEMQNIYSPEMLDWDHQEPSLTAGMWGFI